MIWKRLFGGGDRKTIQHGDRIIEYTPKPGHHDEETAEAGADIGWTPVNPLEEQMAKIPTSVEAQFAFARLLLESDVLLATASRAPEERERVLEEDQDFQVLCVDDNKGGTAAAMFTSQAQLANAFGEGAPYIAMNGRAALQAVADKGAIINPGGGLWTLYNPPTIERILNGDI